MKQEDLISYIYIRVREQKARELIDQLATTDHTLEKYKCICEGCDITDNNAQIFNNTGAEEGGATGGSIHAYRGKGQGKTNNYNNRTKCQNCGNFHKKDACRAKDQKCNICHKLVISARYAKEDNKVQHKAIHREDSYQNKNPAGLEVNKYMILKMIICT